MGGALETIQFRAAAARIDGDVAPTAVGAEEHGGDISDHAILVNLVQIVLIEVTTGMDMAIAAHFSGADTKQQNLGAVL